MKLMTVPEYFELKYSRGLRLLTGCLVALGGVLNMGAFLIVEGKFLTVVSGLDNWHPWGMSSHQVLVGVMTLILALELAYTVLGGMVSVVITDFLQYVLLSTATVLVSIYAVYHAGWGNIVEKVTTTYGRAGINPFFHPDIGWVFLAWQTLLWFSVHTCWQTTAMRMFSTKSPETSKKVMTWTGFIFLGRGMLPMLWGICALTLFGTGALIGGVPSPVVHGKVIEPLNAMPAMLAQILGPGIRGLVVAGMLAATMSVNSSYLLGWSSVISQDIILPIRQFLGKPMLSSNTQILVNRIANLFVSLFVMFWGLYYRLPDVVYKYLNITATIFLAGSFISVVGGIYWKRASTLGGYFAMSLGAVGAIIPLLPESFTWIPTVLRNLNVAGFLAFGCALTGFVLGSLISDLRQKQGPVAARMERR